MEVTVVSGGEAPVAAFSADKTSVEEDTSIPFTDESTGEPTEWQWDFGDGNTSAEQNPTHTYVSEGTYDVELTVSNEEGSDSESKTNYITVNAAGSVPVAAFTANQTSIEEGGIIEFTDQSTNNPTSWSWDFGDGSTSSQQNPT
ncbi:MAG: PKD domain-containing protein [Bacteroidales bacterium]|nr:PKD domain-containing protein [Bacteroidales bacterium]